MSSENNPVPKEQADAFFGDVHVDLACAVAHCAYAR